MKIAITILVSLVGILAYFATTQDTQRKIEQENAKGLYAPNAGYRVLKPNRVIRVEEQRGIGVTYRSPNAKAVFRVDKEWFTPEQVAVIESINDELPLIAAQKKERLPWCWPFCAEVNAQKLAMTGSPWFPRDGVKLAAAGAVPRIRIPIPTPAPLVAADAGFKRYPR